MPSNKPSNHHKYLERLRLDPRFIEIQDKAIADPKNRKQYIAEARATFGLAPGWNQFLDWYLAYPKLELPLTGTSYQPYTDPVTGKTFYMIPVDPETTKENVVRAYKSIQNRYKETGMQFDLRKVNAAQTALEITAFRLHEQGTSNDEILAQLENKFPEAVITKNDIPLLVRAGREKSMG